MKATLLHRQQQLLLNCLSIQMNQLINDNYETAPCMAKIVDKGNIS